ncbi:VTT domain-containing protein [Azospirillum sp.]|uniref:VTT domain-containing protein n=1 Tax=Azospirillum sp. TaxID=34012 RepID=UPI002D51A6FB|nr:VTT domain-containing protein [Azospirillum sp.]HYD70162.1 VTT domain-containing protein [Azospirillum sp.]
MNDMPIREPQAAPCAAPLLVPGRTCWRIERAQRVGLAIDAADYFTYAKAAMRRARRSILLTAWDLDTRVRLTPQRQHPGRPDRLGHFLNWLAATRPDLHIRVLKWDYAEIFDLTRWQRPLAVRRWFTHPRLDYRLDSDHPTGACHHQKLLVVDDAMAFCGGIDLTANRWDTRAHARWEPVRRQPDGKPYEPFHDVMMAVDGDAARALGDLFRERWHRATGQTILPAPPGYDPWPDGLEPLFRDRDVAIARTDPACGGRDEVREVEALYLEAIAAARRCIYLESQYFAAHAIADALAARLAEPDGPEVVLVNPVRTTSWLENEVMLGARAHLAQKLRAADRHGRFRLYAALTDGGTCITVHAKVMVVDDWLLRVGSANLNNRSMGLDTECDLAIEVRPGDPQAAQARATVEGVRNDLLAEHLATSPAVVAQEVARTGSLIRAIDGLRRPGGRTLIDLETPEPSALAATLVEARLFDPERPVPATELVGRVLPSLIPRRRAWMVALAALLVLGGVFALWRIPGLAEWARLDRVLAMVQQVRAMAFGPVLLVGLYVLAGFVVFPVVVLIAATAILLGPVEGFLTAMAGSLASASVLFWVGRKLGRKHLEHVGGRTLAKVGSRLAEKGIVAVATMRVVPAAPFTVINLVAGASRLRFTDYIVGTVVGMAPGILAFSLLGHQLARTLESPTGTDVALLAGVAAVAIGLGWAANRLLVRASEK